MLNSLPPIKYGDLKNCEAHNIPVSSVPIQKLDRLSNQGNHQGIIAEISPIDYTNFFDWIEQTMVGPTTAVLLLDSIEDPHNLGAIIRSATAAGISLISYPLNSRFQSMLRCSKFRQAQLAVRYTSAQHWARSKGFKTSGFTNWARRQCTQFTMDCWMDGTYSFYSGQWGGGIGKKVAKHLDSSVSIPMEHTVESLNASVSAALISYEWKRRQA